MNKKIHIVKRWVLFPLLGVAVIAALCCGSLLAWVIAGPRSIASLTPYIESALTPAPGYKVKIESPEIRWEGWDNPLAVNIRNIDIIDGDAKTIAHFPEAQVKVYLYKMVLGKVVVKEVELIHPDVVLVQNDDGSFFVGSNDKDAVSGNAVAEVLGLLTSGSSNPLSSLRSLIIKHANLSVEKKGSAIFLQSQDTSLEITRKHGVIKGTFSMPLAYDGKNGSISAELNLDKHDKTAKAQVFFKQLPTSAAGKLFPGRQWLEGASLHLSGSLQIASDLDANISDAKFVLESGEGNIKYPAAFDETVNVKQARLIGDITENLTALTVSSGRITLMDDDKPIDISFSGTARKAGDDIGLNLQADTANVPVNNVHRFWPLALAPKTRKWVTGHISNGIVTKADVTLNFKPGDLKMKDIPTESLASTISLKGTTVKYLPGHPPATDINGVVKFTGRSMDVKVASAKYMNSDISQANLRMPDSVPDDVRMYFDMDVKTSAKDVAAFLALPKVEQAAKLGITPDITGSASGNVKFDFIAFSETDREGEDMNYAITANLTGVTQKKFMGKRDIENANVALTLNNKGIKLNGNATVNTVPMSIDLTSSFEKGHNTDYAIKCVMPVKALPYFDLPAFDASGGTIDAAAKFHESDTSSTLEAKLDLTKTDVNIPNIGLIKKAGEQATLDLSTQQLPSGNTQIKPILLQGSNNMIASGSAEIEKASGDIIAATFDRARFDSTDLSALDFRQTADGVKLSAQGNAFDISPYINNSKSLKKGKGYVINVKVAHLIFGDKKEMQNASIDLDCGTTCRSAKIDAKLAEKNNFNYLIKDGRLTATSDNAGELVRVLGVHNNAEGGTLTLDGTYKGDKIEGVLEIKDYTLKGAPILTKILTIASLTGFLDTLRGKGIVFSNLHAPFTYRDGVIVVKDGKSHGSALGLTASGTIDLDASTVDASGVVIPSYTMNSMLGNVPVIGNLLMGGKDQGILAINYTLKGSLDDPSVSVNPLSAFTPGFLRGVFDVFDEPAPDIDKIVEDRKKAAEESKKDVTLPAADATKDPAPTPAPATPPASQSGQ